MSKKCCGEFAVLLFVVVSPGALEVEMPFVPSSDLLVALAEPATRNPGRCAAACCTPKRPALILLTSPLSTVLAMRLFGIFRCCAATVVFYHCLCDLVRSCARVCAILRPVWLIVVRQS